VIVREAGWDALRHVGLWREHVERGERLGRRAIEVLIRECHAVLDTVCPDELVAAGVARLLAGHEGAVPEARRAHGGRRNEAKDQGGKAEHGDEQAGGSFGYVR